MMIRMKHRYVSGSFLPAATSYVHQSFHEETEHDVSFPAVSSVWLWHWMARWFQRIYPDISGYIPDSAENPWFWKALDSAPKADGARPRQKTQHRMPSDTKEKEHERLDHRARSAPERRN